MKKAVAYSINMQSSENHRQFYSQHHCFVKMFVGRGGGEEVGAPPLDETL